MISNKNYNWLGTCRGIAVLGVMFLHFLAYINTALNLNSRFIAFISKDVLDIGKIGVALLFLIAGYLAPSSKKRRNTKQFILNRFLRLYPVYWLDIFLVGIIFHFDGFGKNTVLANLTMLQIFFRKEDLVGLTWTLPIELMLYAGAVVFEKYMWKYKYLITLEVIIGICSVITALIRKLAWDVAPVAIFLLLTIALLGQTCRLYKEGKIKTRELIISVCTFEFVLIVSSLLAYQVDVGHQENWHRYVVSYNIAMIIFGFFMHTEKKLFVLSMISIIAYPLYLLQEIIFRVAFQKIWFIGINVPLFIVGTLLVLVIASILTHVILENPMIKLSRKIESHLS